jgi:hypothetical protein
MCTEKFIQIQFLSALVFPIRSSIKQQFDLASSPSLHQHYQKFYLQQQQQPSSLVIAASCQGSYHQTIPQLTALNNAVTLDRYSTPSSPSTHNTTTTTMFVATNPISNEPVSILRDLLLLLSHRCTHSFIHSLVYVLGFEIMPRSIMNNFSIFTPIILQRSILKSTIQEYTPQPQHQQQQLLEQQQQMQQTLNSRETPF